MGKNIVVCCDGTSNNKDGQQQQWTNVAKLHESLKGNDRSNALYIPGIGTHGFLERVFGPGMGYGIEQNIKEAYKHICARYKPCQDDNIYLFGFSRGAYTVRSLAGFVRKVGLLLGGQSDALIEQAFLHYWWGEQVGESDPLKAFLHHIELPEEPGEGQRVLIYFIGVWDTVPALGFPGFLGRPLKRWVKYHQVELPDHVTYAYQALALHELRECFVPTFWARKTRESQTLEQVWFAGAHADVGGGYDDRTALADVALRWMQSKAFKADTSAQRLNITAGEGVSVVQPTEEQFQPHNTIVDLFLFSNPTHRALFRNEYDDDALASVWETIKLHQSVQKHWSNTAAREYKYGKAVNEQLRQIDDRSVQFHCEQFSKYGIDLATD